MGGQIEISLLLSHRHFGVVVVFLSTFTVIRELGDWIGHFSEFG